MKTVKSLVLGSLIKSQQDEREQGIPCYNTKMSYLQANEDCQTSRREAGWIMLQGMLHLGSEWVIQNIEQILMLFYSVFNKDMCIISGFSKGSQILKELDLKLQALEALTILICRNRKLLEDANKHNIKLVS